MTDTRDDEPISAFPFGLRVFFRTTAANGTPHFETWRAARDVSLGVPDAPEGYLVLLSETAHPLAYINSDAVAMIVPVNKDGNYVSC